MKRKEKQLRRQLRIFPKYNKSRRHPGMDYRKTPPQNRRIINEIK
jgi:hypothetical protein